MARRGAMFYTVGHAGGGWSGLRPEAICSAEVIRTKYLCASHYPCEQAIPRLRSFFLSHLGPTPSLPAHARSPCRTQALQLVRLASGFPDLAQLLATPVWYVEE